MAISTRVLRDADEIGSVLADLVLSRYLSRARPLFLLGCPGGRSLTSTYRTLAGLAARQAVDLSGLVIVMMDEYVVATEDGFAPVAADLPHSCRWFGREEIVGRLNAGRPAPAQVPAEHLWLPDPEHPDAYEDRIVAAGGVDLFLLASGAGDGHVAFNPPGTAADARTRVVALPESTRRDNLVTFPSFGGRLSAVPEHGVTVGVATIRDLAAEVVMVLHGSDKALAARRLTSAAGYREDWPATVCVECRSPTLLLDRAAAGALPSAATTG
ncbi:MAG TPA: 6-phosphogluconolactonase [Microlunatus sp.]|nr:6-phosphogluconolactonase [Microlunatus sp.]